MRAHGTKCSAAVLVAVIALLHGCSPPATPSMSEPAPSARSTLDLEVHVYDEQGNPVPDDQVQWISPSGTIFKHLPYFNALETEAGSALAGAEPLRSEDPLHGFRLKDANIWGHCLIQPPSRRPILNVVIRKSSGPVVCDESEHMIPAEAANLPLHNLLAAHEYVHRGTPLPTGAGPSIKKAFPGLDRVAARPLPCGESRRSAVSDEIKRRKVDLPQLRGDIPDDDADWFDTRNFSVKYAFQGKWELEDQCAPIMDEDLKLFGGQPTKERLRKDAKTRRRRVSVPRVVQEIAAIAEHSLTVFERRGLTKRLWASPPPGGCTEGSTCRCTAGCNDRRLKIVVMKIASHGETQPDWDHFTISDDKDNRDAKQNFITVPHELFHRIQYSYTHETWSDLRGMFIEGGAMMAGDGIDDAHNCYAGFGEAWSTNPMWQLIDDPRTRCKSQLAYAAGVFWKYFVEQCSPGTGAPDDLPGIEAYEEVLRLVRDHDLSAVRRARCPARPGDSFPALLADHYTTQFLAGIPGVNAPERFRYREHCKDIHCPDNRARGRFAFRTRTSGAKISAGTTVTCSDTVGAWSGDFSQFKVHAPLPSQIRLKVNAPGCWFRVVRLDKSNRPHVDDGGPVSGYSNNFSATDLELFGVVVSCMDQPTQLRLQVEGVP